MRRCLELSKLPKAPRISSLHFRRQTPGSAADTVFANRSSKRLDPDHPIDLLPGKQKPFIWANTPATRPFTLGAIPMGLLMTPQYTPFFPSRKLDSWSARVARGTESESVAPMLLNNPRSNRLAMSLQLATTRDTRPCQRSKIRRRLKTALSLIATRGAYTEEVKGRPRLVVDETKAPENLILQGWTYFLRPSLELYRMPYPELVQLLRPMLREIWTRATKMEAEWTKASIGGSAGPRSQTRSGTRRATSQGPASNELPLQGDTSWESALEPESLNQQTRPSDPSSSPEPRRERDQPKSARLTGREPQQTWNSDLWPSPEPRRELRNGSRATGQPQRTPRSTAEEPEVPAFDPFPTVRAPSVFPPDPVAPRSPPPPSPSAPSTPAKKPDWWAVGRTIEAGVGQVTEGSTRWDRPDTGSAPKKPATQPLQRRIKSMLYREDVQVARPNAKERAAGKMARETRRFEEK
ncbi:hypothetical protein FB451DRAFT_147207 [Mycena latifolia]|nr:hypothetical protein FB451DRAFT_147207 [Mycena latifolia]